MEFVVGITKRCPRILKPWLVQSHCMLRIKRRSQPPNRRRSPMPRKVTRAERTPLPAEQIAAMMAEAERRYNDNPDSAYGSAHAVLALCREIQRQAKVIEELERRATATSIRHSTKLAVHFLGRDP
jgi:hypothetical protein